MVSERDRVYMARCLELAEGYRGRTAPNPIVGCVIVRGDKVLAEGVHKGPGTEHAEANALAKLRGVATGATLYVNLEPCNHQGRTPPCAPAVLASGVARVVIGIEDPIPGHAGGAALLRRSRKPKIAVTTGVLRAECERANRPFLTWGIHHRPAFTLKAAITLDGKICTVTGDSKWITGERARLDVMKLRDTHDAVLVGVGTVLADDPQLSARLPGARDPMRIVLDGELRTPPTAQLLPKKRGPRTIIACRADAPARRETALVAKGAEVWRLQKQRDGRLDLDALASRLGEAGMTSVLVEGGGEVHASFLARRLADQVILYIAPKIVGGPARSWVGGEGIGTLNAATTFAYEGPPVDLGGDLKLIATLAPIAVRDDDD